MTAPAEAPWCGGRTPWRVLEHPVWAAPTGECPQCGRRVRLLSTGKLRRHRRQSSVVMVGDRLARRT